MEEEERVEEERVEEERARIRTGNPCLKDELSNSRCERGDDAIMQSVWCKPELAVVSSRKVGTCLTVNSCPRVLYTVHCVNSCPQALYTVSTRALVQPSHTHIARLPLQSPPFFPLHEIKSLYQVTKPNQVKRQTDFAFSA